jgi:hypothetical protein
VHALSPYGMRNAAAAMPYYLDSWPAATVQHVFGVAAMEVPCHSREAQPPPRNTLGTPSEMPGTTYWHPCMQQPASRCMSPTALRWCCSTP